ncbi:MAG: DUF3110 domain-containing protein [Spirulinaceae cyanobacterium]
MRVYVLLFNARTENEGIHSIQISGRNQVLMFESEDDATRFALMLEAQDFPLATVEEIDSEEVESICRDAGYGYKLVEQGTLELPPEQNVEDKDWDLEGQEKQEQEETSETEMSDLDRIRQQLEGLL